MAINASMRPRLNAGDDSPIATSRHNINFDDKCDRWLFLV